MCSVRLLRMLLGIVGLFFVFSTTVFSATQAQALPRQAPNESQLIQPGEVPAGLSSSDWAGIQAQLAASKYKPKPDKNGSGFGSSNPAHGWNIHFSADGTTTLKPREPQAQGYHLGLKLSAIGYTQLQALGQPQKITAKDSTVIYQWDDSIREWWVNDEAGLEQWFELKQRPPGMANGQPLKLEMTLGTEMDASQHGNELRFVNATGITVSYSKLKVWDSRGDEIPALMHLQNNTVSLLIDDRAAIYPLTVDPVFQQQAYLKASNTDIDDYFGLSVAISGDTLVVGAFQEASSAIGVNGDQADNSAGRSGAAYVFTRTDGVWSQQAYLKASNTGENDLFGFSIAISGDTLVVGALYEGSNATGVNGDQTNNAESQSGAAYVFTRTAGVWSQQAYLKASNTGASDGFGISVAISGDTLVVGAGGEDSNATGVNGDQANNSAGGSGAAYVFTRTDGLWSQQAYLKASNTETNDYFGYSIAISGGTLVVGAFQEASSATGVNGDQTNNSAADPGAAYVFTRTDGVWSQQAYLKASNTGEGDRFGYSVAISGDTLVVGAEVEDSNATGVDGDQANNSAGGSGAAYVFTRTAGVWSQQAYLKASNTGAVDGFGISVAISGDTLVVGAGGEDSNATGVDGDQANNSADNSGAAYVFTRTDDVWSQQAYLKASNTGMFDGLGGSVAISGDTLVVGAGGEASNATGVNGDQANNSAGYSGAAYVFKLAFTIGGNVSGLAGSGLVLQYNLGNDHAVSANGSFTFTTPLTDGTGYAVSVKTQPTNPSQTCAVSNGSGTLAGANVTNVAVTCTTTYTIGGMASGLQGSGLVLQNNAGDDLTVNESGSFTFVSALEDLSGYTVTVLTHPTNPSQTCLVTNGVGALAGADVDSVQVDCTTNSFTIGGNVSGLEGTGLELQNNDGDDLTVDADGDFTFFTSLLDLSSYSVTIVAQPGSPAQTCSVANDGTGTLAGANVTNVSIACHTLHSMGGSVSGLVGTGLVLQNNGGDNLLITGEGAFTFANPVEEGSTYFVSVATQPSNPSQTCTVSNGSGTMAEVDVTEVAVSCVIDSFTIGGTISGLEGSGLILRNNGLDDLIITSNGTFSFNTPLLDLNNYAVSVALPPSLPEQICTLINASGTLAGANVTSVQVNCITKYTIGGTVSGLQGNGLVLQNNGGEELSVNSNGSFTFNQVLLNGSGYSVSILSQPTQLSQTCTVSNGSGSLAGGNVNDVQVDCATNTYLISGAVTGLGTTGIILQLNDDELEGVASDRSFTFNTELLDGSAFNVAVVVQPSDNGRACTVLHGSGILDGADITNILVNCVIGTFAIGGEVTGLEGSGLILQNNGMDDLEVFSDGPFVFPKPLSDSSDYAVSVLTKPKNPGQDCSVFFASGTLNGNHINNILVICETNGYSIGGTVSGLAGSGLTLTNNGEVLLINSNGSFTFNNPQADATFYDVDILIQPEGPSQTCSLNRDSGTLAGADINQVEVVCETDSFTIGGTVTGLSGEGLVLQNNGGDSLSIESDGRFSFHTPIPDGNSFEVIVLTQPNTVLGELCRVTYGLGTVRGGNVDEIDIRCDVIIYASGFE